MAERRSALQDEIKQRAPFHSTGAEVAVGILRTAALVERHYYQIVTKRGSSIQQYSVRRILRGAGARGMPTLVIRMAQSNREEREVRGPNRWKAVGVTKATTESSAHTRATPKHARPTSSRSPNR